MIRWRRQGLAWLVLAIYLLPAPALAQATKAGVVTTLEGNVTAARAVASQPVVLKFKDDVFPQDRVVTGEQSFARLLLGGKAVVSIRERSAVTITEVPGRSTIEIESGKIALSVARDRMLPGEIINIKTPNAVAGVRGTVVVAEVTRRGGQPFTNLWVIRGIVDAVHTNLQGAPLSPAVTLKAQESLSATPTTSSKDTFTPAQVGTIVQGLQPQRTQDGGSASQSPARLEAVNTAAALLGVLPGTEAGQEQVALLTAPPAPATPPDLRPKVNVDVVGGLTSAPTELGTLLTKASSGSNMGSGADVSDVIVNTDRKDLDLLEGRTLKTFTGISTRPGLSPLISITTSMVDGSQSIVDGSQATLVIVKPDADATLQAGPLMKVTSSTLDMPRVLLVQGNLASLGTSPLIGLKLDSLIGPDPMTVNAQTLIEITAGRKLSLAGPLLTDLKGRLTARQDAISVAGTLTGTGTGALVALQGTSLTVGVLASQAQASLFRVTGSASLAGGLLDAVSAPIQLTGDVIGIFNGATVLSASTSPFIRLDATSLTAGVSDVSDARIAFVAGVGGPNGDTQASLKLSGSLLEASNGTVVDVRGVNGNAVRLDAALLEATAPLIVLMGNATRLQTSGNAIDLTNSASLTTTSADALIKIENQARMDVLNGHLLNVSASRVDVLGDFLRMGSNALLNVKDGVLLAVLNGGVANINGALVRFTGTNATINVMNNILPTLIIGDILPVSIAPGANVNIGPGALAGLNLNGNTIRINGTPLLPGALGITGSLISVGANGTLRIGGSLN